MNNKERLLKKKENLLKEIEKIDKELSDFESAIKVINFRGATIGNGEYSGHYEMFDMLWRLTDKEYEDLMDSDEYTIFDVLGGIIDNHIYYEDPPLKRIDDLDIISDLFECDVLYFDKEKRNDKYNTELCVRFGYEKYDFININLQVCTVPMKVYDNFESVCISRYPLIPY